MKHLLIGALFVALAACASGPTPEQMAQQEAIVFQSYQKQANREIRAVLQAQSEAWSAGSVEGYMEGYWPSEELRFASGGNIVWGFDETLQRYKARYPDAEAMGDLSFEIQEVKVFSESDAMVFGRWFLARESAEDLNGLFTVIFKKIDGQWLIVSDHTS